MTENNVMPLPAKRPRKPKAAAKAEKKVRPRFKRQRQVFFKEWRKHRGLTQEQLAERVHRATSWVSQLENGKIGFTEETLDALAAVLRCDPADLIMRDPNSPVWSIMDTLKALPAEQQAQVAQIVETFKKAG